MTAERFFFDTNILVYAYDEGSPGKRVAARALLENALDAATGVLSTQVVNEFYQVMVVRRKILPSETVERLIRRFDDTMRVEWVDMPLVLSAITLHRRFGTAYWDSLVLAAARRAGCAKVYSEDFNHGQDYDGVTAHNPFLGG